MLTFFIIFSVLFCVFVSFPYIRILLKRIKLRFVVINVCKKRGFKLVPAHKLWFLGNNKGDICDFYIETPSIVYSVKLYSVKKKGSQLIFKDDGTFFVRNFVAIPSTIGQPIRIPIDKKISSAPSPDFLYKFQDEWYLKENKRVLLINPTCREVKREDFNMRSQDIGSGDTVNGIFIYTLSRFTNHIENL